MALNYAYIGCYKMSKVISYTNINKSMLQQIATDLAKTVKKSDIICLIGDLGVGKTLFTRYLIKAISGNLYDEQVISPTYNIVNQYDVKNRFIIWHYDLYRIENSDELYELGLEESLQNGVSIIEWPEIAFDWFNSGIYIYISVGDDPQYRNLSIKYK